MLTILFFSRLNCKTIIQSSMGNNHSQTEKVYLHALKQIKQRTHEEQVQKSHCFACVFVTNHYLMSRQAKCFLNAFWTEKFTDDLSLREKIWKETQGIIQIDPKGKEGYEINEVKARLFIEKFSGGSTWISFRDVMRKIDKDFNNKMSLTEYFIFHYKLDWQELVEREHQDKEVQTTSNKTPSSEPSRWHILMYAAMQNAKKGMIEEEVRAGLALIEKEEAKKVETVKKAAEEEVRAGLALIEKEEAKKVERILKYKKIVDDPSTSTVKKGKAFQQMKREEGEDLLLLRKAKIEHQTKVRKAKKALKIAAKRVKKATAEAEKAAAAAKQAETTLKQTSKTVLDVTDSLVGAGAGTLWWMDRELEEVTRSLCGKKQSVLSERMAAAKKTMLSSVK